MTGKIKPYFTCANSSRGFKNFFSSNLKDLKKIFILKGGPGCGKSSLIKKIGTYCLNKNFDVEYIHCSSDPDSLDGIIIRSIGIGIVDGTAPHVIEPQAPGAIEEYVNMGIAWDIDKLSSYTNNILELKGAISHLYKKIYSQLEKARIVHDEWEKIYTSNMDFSKANQITDDNIHKIFNDIKINKKSTIYHRFFGATAANGPTNFINDITSICTKRYFIKGRPGSGKSTLLKKIVKTAGKRGLDCEAYHCSFDPESLDMVLIPELSTCIFDSTPPHSYEPSRKNDYLIDMYAETIDNDTDKKFSKALLDINTRYDKCINDAISNFVIIKNLHDELEKYYINCTDFKLIDNIYDTLIKRIDKYLL